MTRMAVVLPAPLCPMKPKQSPASIVRERSSSTCWFPNLCEMRSSLNAIGADRTARFRHGVVFAPKMFAVLRRVFLVSGLLATLGVAEETAWRALARKLPDSADQLLAAVGKADITASEEAMVHMLLARAYRSLERFDDAYRHAESALALIPPAIDASPGELELRRLCSEVALRSGRIERSESHAVRLGLAADIEAPGGRKALADALDRLMEASRWRGAVFEAIAVGPAIRAVAIEDGARIFAPRPLIRYAALLIDGGQFVPALRILDEVDFALPDKDADREHGLSKLARARASRRMGNPSGARKQMREARKFISCSTIRSCSPGWRWRRCWRASRRARRSRRRRRSGSSDTSRGGRET